MIESSKYSVDPEGLKQVNSSRQPLANRIFGQIVSYLFHPLFIPTYVAAFLLFVHPLAFAGFSDQMKFFRFASVIVSTALLPAFAVFLMWRLQLVITSLQMKTQKERVIPYAIAMIFYFWVWYVFKSLSDSPVEIRQFLLGAFLSVCAAWFLNIFMRVSMHTTAMGGVLIFFLLLAFRDPVFNGPYLSIAILVTGLVTTSRMIVSHHTSKEIYAGLLAGALAQIIATWFV